jgi:hypothetical protein
MREALRKWPIVTNGLLVGFVTGSGDILAQRLRNRHDSLVSFVSVARQYSEPAPLCVLLIRDTSTPPTSRCQSKACSALQAKHNWQRTALMGTWGVTIFGPMWAWWYRFLDARLHVYSAQSIAAKVAITATVMAPISNALFFTFMTAGERIMHKV